MAVAAALAAVGGCGAAGSTNHQVTVVGDSLSVLGDAQIRDQLTLAGWTPTVDAFAGRTVATQMLALDRAARGRDRAVVIQLGTNDAHAVAQGETDATSERNQVRLALGLFATDRCLVWVNADADPSRPGKSGGKVVDDIVEEASRTRPNLHIADLHTLLMTHPEYLGPDGVHLTDAGSTALGRLMADALAACR